MSPVQHSAKSDQWGTPQDIIEAAREVMGSIDLDPCSSEKANERVRASEFLTDGLAKDRPWLGSILMNPPGGLTAKRASLPLLFWRRLMHECGGIISNPAQAIVVGFTLEQLRMTQQAESSMLDFPICIPRARLKFFPLDGQKAGSPAHGNVLVYVPGVVDNTEKFVKVFSQFGAVKV